MRIIKNKRGHYVCLYRIIIMREDKKKKDDRSISPLPPGLPGSKNLQREGGGSEMVPSHYRVSQ